MNDIWRLAGAILLVLGVAWPGAAQADVVEVECGSLESIAITGDEQYDEMICQAGQFTGLAQGDYRGPVGGRLEVIIALNRATIAIVRFDASNRRSFMELPSVQEHIDGILPTLEPRNWGEERRYERFTLANVEARIADGSPYLECVGFLSRLRPAIGAPGYREALGGIYCAADTLAPTEAEVASFLDGLKF